MTHAEGSAEIVKLRFMLGVKLAAFNQFVAERLGLSVTDMECLEVAYFDEVQPVTPGRLSKLMGLSPGSITTSLKNLERAGLIAREPDPTDGRRILLRFIPGSRATVNACFEAVNRSLAEFDDTLGSEELESVKNYLSAMLRIIDNHMADSTNRLA
ncbi:MULTISPECIES: MarR family winged helix-turn-helix transcriptional regulator [unclassified Paraburkholderia]|uniref:MarR family winged helix-turn-helix transcriptional regulator n=1 Tax=unclassified Paraburkholderia TaxID=2615204 RepID=UPI00160D39F2|nr:MULTISPECIES: MarR family transcriptional regulator [unclassified Paraburkholderia]MBB5448157.1 DNA-binding MarR family transcriptional regulator [Paraburkholderia sp. WSM4177]MBB5488573.1 DNA-binding MarR family transcriptional regulator [Paraburkholderia sp. WSM4180]